MTIICCKLQRSSLRLLILANNYFLADSRKTKKDWAVFIKEIADELYEDAKKITLVMNNLNTYKPSSLYEAFEPNETKRIWDRFEFVFTPKHGSWLNMAAYNLMY